MCELFGMSASYEADLDVSLSLLRPCGREICPHAEGWGVAFYEGRAARVLKEPKSANQGSYFYVLRGPEFASHTVLAHIRRADAPETDRQFSNTHPFERELLGCSWVFAHNGKLPGIEEQPLVDFHPIGETDSEHAFCMLLDTARDYLSESGKLEDVGMLDRLARTTSRINQHGEFNFLLSNGEYLFVHAHTYLHTLERRARAEEGDRAVFLIATHPLTDDEPWACLVPNSLSVFRNGQLIAQQPTQGRAANEAWRRQRDEAEVVRQLRREAEVRWAEIAEGMNYDSG